MTCACPDPWCPVHARCRCGSELVIIDDDPAFCPACGHDVTPVGACSLDGRLISRDSVDDSVDERYLMEGSDGGK